MPKNARLLLVLLAFSGCAALLGPAHPTLTELARIRDDAVYIYDAERAAIRATDLLRSREGVDERKVSRYLVLPRGPHWYVVFGVLEHDTFTAHYAFRAPLSDPKDMVEVQPQQFPRELLPAARAVDEALRLTEELHGRSQLDAVVREESNQLVVWVTQASTEPGLHLLGGDTRYTFTRDGLQLISKRPLHESVIPLDMRGCADRCQGFMHTHSLYAGPVETEWAYLMLYPELRELYVGLTGSAVYALKPDGRITVHSR